MSNELDSVIVAIDLMDQLRIASKHFISFPTITRKEAVKVVLLQYSLYFVVCLKNLPNATVDVRDPIVLNVKRCTSVKPNWVTQIAPDLLFLHPTRAKLRFGYQVVPFPSVLCSLTAWCPGSLDMKGRAAC